MFRSNRGVPYQKTWIKAETFPASVFASHYQPIFLPKPSRCVQWTDHFHNQVSHHQNWWTLLWRHSQQRRLLQHALLLTEHHLVHKSCYVSALSEVHQNLPTSQAIFHLDDWAPPYCKSAWESDFLLWARINFHQSNTKTVLRIWPNQVSCGRWLCSPSQHRATSLIRMQLHNFIRSRLIGSAYSQQLSERHQYGH